MTLIHSMRPMHRAGAVLMPCLVSRILRVSYYVTSVSIMREL